MNISLSHYHVLTLSVVLLLVLPLVIPEVNPDHLALIARQRRERGWSGAIVTNPNCSTVVLAMALAPLRPFGIRTVVTTTLQAVSGAGYPGVPSFDAPSGARS